MSICLVEPQFFVYEMGMQNHLKGCHRDSDLVVECWLALCSAHGKCLADGSSSSLCQEELRRNREVAVAEELEGKLKEEA